MRTPNRLNLYEILRVSPAASIEEIKKAFRRLALRHHPDKNENRPDSTARFKVLHNAYTVLSDPAARAEYDSVLFAVDSAVVAAPERKRTRQAEPYAVETVDTLSLVLDHLNFILWEIEELLHSTLEKESKRAERRPGMTSGSTGGAPGSKHPEPSVRDYVVMMLTFIDRWILSAAGFPDYFFQARGMRPDSIEGGTTYLPHENLQSAHRPYADVDDYFLDVRRRADRFLNRSRLVDLFEPVAGTSLRLVDCILETHNYCFHYVGWIKRAWNDEPADIPPFRHSNSCFEP